MARIYANENLALPVVEELQRLGHDVLTSQQAGNGGRAIPDEEVLRFAAADSRIVLTFNRRHFVKLHQQAPDHQGIIVCTYDADFCGLAARIAAAIENAGDLRMQLIRVNRPSP